MLVGLASIIESLLIKCHQAALRFAPWIIALVVLAALPSVSYIAQHLKINTDDMELLSNKLTWRKEFIQYKKLFPQYSDSIAVVIDAQTADAAQSASRILGKRLAAESQLFEDVYQPETLDFFQQNQFLFLDSEQLADLSDNLAKVQPFLGRLNADPSLRGLLNTMSLALDEISKGEQYDLNRAFESFNIVLAAHTHQQRSPLSWQSLMSGRKITAEDKRSFIMVKPRLDYSKLLPGKRAFLAIHEIADQLGLTKQNGFRVRLTGGAALTYEEMLSVTEGSSKAALYGLITVAVLLLIGYRSVWLTLATLVTLILSIIFTGVFATFTVGRLNLISVGFAIFNIGLGGDYAIQYCLRYREILLSTGQERQPALKLTGRYIAGSLVLCALATAIGFFAFLPTSYVGVAELGIIAGGGMLISVSLSLTFLPALLRYLPVKSQNKTSTDGLFTSLANIPSQYAKKILTSTAVLAIVAVVILPLNRFDHNPVHLQNQHAESVQTYKDLLAQSSRSPLSIVMTVQNEEQINGLKDQLKRLKTVDSVVSIQDFVPMEQTDKLAIIEEMSFLLGPDLMQGPNVAHPNLADQLRALINMSRALQNYLQTESIAPSPVVIKFAEHFATFLQQLKAQNDDQRLIKISALEQDLVGALPDQLTTLRNSLQAQVFDLNDLPTSIKERWVSATQDYRLEVFPSEDLDDLDAMRRFVDSVRQVAPQATGAPVLHLESGSAIIKAFQEAFVYAITVIIILLFFTLHQKIDVIFGLSPLILAGLFTGALCVLLGLQFNFANIIAIPLFLSMGIDSGIHILHRYRTAPPEDGLLLSTGTAKAVALSTLTSVFGFGNLLVSPHWGTASMGLTLALGNALTLVCTFIILPSLLLVFGQKR